MRRSNCAKTPSTHKRCRAFRSRSNPNARATQLWKPVGAAGSVQAQCPHGGAHPTQASARVDSRAIEKRVASLASSADLLFVCHNLAPQKQRALIALFTLCRSRTSRFDRSSCPSNPRACRANLRIVVDATKRNRDGCRPSTPGRNQTSVYVATRVTTDRGTQSMMARTGRSVRSTRVW